ncbi:hypothetical protein ACIREE_25900 [Streptomyces sp. NPDC102467]|uniref:hypothetical protein n=1 Tax=Streptomyces sp. NPDC102467 TaxID=3366179 RepID=UPI00380E01C3
MADRNNWQDPNTDPFDPQDEWSRQEPGRERHEPERETPREDGTRPLLPEKDQPGYRSRRDSDGYR